MLHYVRLYPCRLRLQANAAAADLEEVIERPSAIDPLAAGGRVSRLHIVFIYVAVSALRNI